MSTNDGNLDDLTAYAQTNERMCPMPRCWHELYNIISPPQLERPGGARLNWTPPGPLILGGWRYTSVEEKRLRLREHLEYAAAHGLFAEVDRFLRALPESEWAHTCDF